jgi:hypothetical protein
MDMETLQAIVNVIILPIMAGMLAWFDKRNSKRGLARDEFNLLLLKGLERIGKVAILTAHKQQSRIVDSQLDKAIIEYENFEKEIAAFKDKSVKKAVRV